MWVAWRRVLATSSGTYIWHYLSYPLVIYNGSEQHVEVYEMGSTVASGSFLFQQPIPCGIRHTAAKLLLIWGHLRGFALFPLQCPGRSSAETTLQSQWSPGHAGGVWKQLGLVFQSQTWLVSWGFHGIGGLVWGIICCIQAFVLEGHALRTTEWSAHLGFVFRPRPHFHIFHCLGCL